MNSGFTRAKQNHLLYYQPILEKEGYIKTVNEKGQTVYVRKRQLGSNLEREVLIQFIAQTMPQNVLKSPPTGIPCDIRIPNKTRYKVDDMILSFTVTNSSTTTTITLAPALLCIDHIEISNNGGQVIQTLYAENLFFALATMSTEQLESISYNIGVTPDLLTSTNVLPPGASRTFYCPLIGNLFEQTKIYLGAIKDDILVRVFFTTATEVGDVTAPELEACSIWLVCKDFEESNDVILEKFYLENTVEFPYLNNQVFQATQTFNANQQYSFQMSTINGMCPIAVLSFRQSTSNVNAGRRTFTYIGDNGYWYIGDLTSKNIWSSSNIPGALSRFIMSSYNVPGDLFAKIPVIPVLPGEPVISLTGSKDGGFYYFSGNDYIVFNAASNTEVPEVQTITTYSVGTSGKTQATPISGNFILSYKGSCTQLLAFNASSTVVQTALQKLDTVQKEGLVVTVVNNLSSNGTLTITISNFDGVVPSQTGGVFVMIMSDLSNSSGLLVGETTITTTGVLGNVQGTGFSSGFYTLSFNAWVWHKLVIKEGNIRVNSQY